MTIYKILDSEIEVSTSIENACYINKIFNPYIESAENMMRKWYKKQGDCSSVLRNVDDLQLDIVIHLLDDAFDVISSNGIYTIDKKTLGIRFMNNCFNELEKNINSMITDLELIDFDKESAAEYRRERKANRDRVIGGGFGFSGAVKGMATAGVMNAASGVGHSMLNAAGNAVSGIGASLKKSNCYSEYENIFVEAANDSIWCIKAEIREILRSEKNIQFEFQTIESQEKGNAILQNFIDGNIPRGKGPEMLTVALNSNYHNPKIYETIWINYGDRTGDLVKMASAFGYSLDGFILDYVNDYGSKACEECCPQFMQHKNRIKASVIYEEDIKKTISKIEEFCKDHDVASSKCSTIKTLNDCLEIADKLKRTVEGVLYDTESEANEIRHDIKVFNDILDSKNIFDDDAFERVSSGDYLSQKFKDELSKRFECELALRNPSTVLESLYDLAVKSNANEKTKSIFGILGKCGNIEETKVVFEQICIMQPNEIALAIIDRSIGLFSNKGKGQSGVLFTNLNLRIFSKKLFEKENEIFPLTEIKDIAALGDYNYLIATTSGRNYKFKIHMGEMTIEEQNFLADLIYRCTQLIKHIYIDQRVQLGNILKPESAKCICPKCGGYVEINSRFCCKCGHQMLETDKKISNETTADSNSSNDLSAESFINSESEGIVICPSCGKENDRMKKFCQYCGDALEETNSAMTGDSVETDAKVKLEDKQVKKQDQKKTDSKHLAVTSLIFGIISYLLILTIIPPIITSIMGVVFGFKGFKSKLKKTAVIGIIINISFLILFISIFISA